MRFSVYKTPHLSHVNLTGDASDEDDDSLASGDNGPYLLNLISMEAIQPLVGTLLGCTDHTRHKGQ